MKTLSKAAKIIEITKTQLSPERVVESAKSEGSGCVVAYVGLIRNQSQGRSILSVEQQDPAGKAAGTVHEIADEARNKWSIENVAISHRIGILQIGEINLVVAVASTHRGEGFAAWQYIIPVI